MNARVPRSSVVQISALLVLASFAGARPQGGIGLAGARAPTNVAPVFAPDFSKPGCATVNALEVFDDGHGPALYIGGLGGGPVGGSGIVRYDGRGGWDALGAGLGGFPTKEAYALEAFGSRLYVGGWFTSAGGVAANYIAAWNGTTWEALGTGMSASGGAAGVVYALTSFDDGGGARLYAGGYFTQSDGVATNRIARWSGTSWSALGSGLDAAVRALCVFDGELYAGGDFTTAGGQAASHIARWDGAAWSPVGGGVDAKVLALHVFGGALYVGGEFVTAGGLTVNHVARWNGTSWSALGAGTGTANVGGPTRVKCFASFGGELYTGGDFTTIDGAVTERLAKWNGAAWQPIAPGASASVNALATLDAGSGDELWAGGAFYDVGGVTVYSLGGFDGLAWHPTEPNDGVSGTLRSFESWDDGNGRALYAGGSFEHAGTTAARYIAGYRDGAWFPLGSGVDDDDQNGEVFVYALRGFDDGSGPSLFAGGSFVSMGGVICDGIARWDGAQWHSVGGGANDEVWSLAVFDDGSGPALYMGGLFTTAGGVTVNGLAKWDGVQWSALPGIGCLGYALEVFDDGSGPALFVGGVVSINGVSAGGLAKWNGQQWSALDGGVYGGSFPRVYALAAHDDGNGAALYVGGRFTTAGSSALPVNYVAKWNGAQWSALGSGMAGSPAYVWSLESTIERIDESPQASSGGSGAVLIAGGQFTSSGGVATNRLARWDGASWSSVGGGVGTSSTSYVWALHPHVARDAGGLYLGGSFSKAGTVTSSSIARWGAP